MEGLCEPTTDTWAVIGWGAGKVVLSFRGTVSNKNLMTDLKAWSCSYTPHPRLTREDVRKRGWFRKMEAAVPVRVHSGFWAAWTGGGFNERVVERVKSAVAEAAAGTDGVATIFVTGHSVGLRLWAPCASSESACAGLLP